MERGVSMGSQTDISCILSAPGIVPIMTPLVCDRVWCRLSVTATTRTSCVVPDRSPLTTIQFHSVSIGVRLHGSNATPSPPSAASLTTTTRQSCITDVAPGLCRSTKFDWNVRYYACQNPDSRKTVVVVASAAAEHSQTTAIKERRFSNYSKDYWLFLQAHLLPTIICHLKNSMQLGSVFVFRCA